MIKKLIKRFCNESQTFQSIRSTEAGTELVPKINFKPLEIIATDCYDFKNACLSTLTTLGTNMKKLIVAIVTAAFTSLAMAQAAAPVAEPAAAAAPAPTAKKTKSHKSKAAQSKKSTKKHSKKKPSAKKK